MSNPTRIDEILTSSLSNVINDNDSNDNHKISNNDITVNNGGKYALDKSKFTPNSEKTMLAEEIASSLGEISNYAGILKMVNKHGVINTRRCWINVLSDVKEKANTKYPVRNKGAYFMWKLKMGLY